MQNNINNQLHEFCLYMWRSVYMCVYVLVYNEHDDGKKKNWEKHKQTIKIDNKLVIQTHIHTSSSPYSLHVCLCISQDDNHTNFEWTRHMVHEYFCVIFTCVCALKEWMSCRRCRGYIFVCNYLKCMHICVFNTRWKGDTDCSHMLPRFCL